MKKDNFKKILNPTSLSIKDILGLIKGFFDKDLSFYAASLSFYTIFTIIPLLLFSLSIFTQLPVFDTLSDKIKELIFSNLIPTNTDAIAIYIDGFLANSVKMGVVGFVSIFIASIMFFHNYEYIVSKIFQSNIRGFWQSLTIYWTMLTLMPVALAVSFYLSNIIQEFLTSNSFTSWINFLELFPYLIIWAIFFVTYKISANIDIDFKAVLFSSFITSSAWYIAKSAFIQYVFHNNTYNTLYGSFSILLFFFLWLYISWIIFLYGLKLCSILHNRVQNNNLVS